MRTPAWPIPNDDEQGLEFDLEVTPDWRIRDAVRTLLAPDDSVVVEDAVLVTDEMVANAREHARPPWRCRLTVFAGSGRLRIEVDDGGRGDPYVREPDLTGGRGMILLDRLALAWGVVHHQRFKTVWAELPLDRPRLSPVAPAPDPQDPAPGI
ncbi:ATP-binding protein [Nocardia suismassiliense]|uniref:ATP-binding protein n=1 Tax=Nocardia suismassiliense TaxID=2077092 RepID=UPI000D1F92F9|nr:ATP-binding protein [Nocardia suismassiliense]